MLRIVCTPYFCFPVALLALLHLALGCTPLESSHHNAIKARLAHGPSDPVAVAIGRPRAAPCSELPPGLPTMPGTRVHRIMVQHLFAGCFIATNLLLTCQHCVELKKVFTGDQLVLSRGGQDNKNVQDLPSEASQHTWTATVRKVHLPPLPANGSEPFDIAAVELIHSPPQGLISGNIDAEAVPMDAGLEIHTVGIAETPGIAPTEGMIRTIATNEATLEKQEEEKNVLQQTILSLSSRIGSQRQS